MYLGFWGDGPRRGRSHNESIAETPLQRNATSNRAAGQTGPWHTLRGDRYTQQAVGGRLRPAAADPRRDQGDATNRIPDTNGERSGGRSLVLLAAGGR